MAKSKRNRLVGAAPPAERIPAGAAWVRLFLPGLTVFTSSFCIMTVELVAGRLIARHLGSSLYTWTSVIGVVLAGIALGNYLGGRIADRRAGRESIAALFVLSALACLTVPILNQWVGEWELLWELSWPGRVACHVAAVFLAPSVMMGTISPVAAKVALDQGLATGRTVGAVYAWGAIGSIVGTFVTGFFLISRMGTMAVVYTVGGVLAVFGLGYGVRFWFSRVAVVVVGMLMVMGMGPWDWARRLGERLALRERADPYVVYQTESQYSLIQVERTGEDDPQLTLRLDTLAHSILRPNEPRQLQYGYERIYDALTRRLCGEKKRLKVLMVGGGGFAFPRYLELEYPGSHIEVAEIDPAVTEAAFAAFELPADTTIRIYNLDGRNHVENLVQKRAAGPDVPRFDFIYGDAVNDLSVPYHLTTLEYNRKIRDLLADDGAYMITMIDSFHSARFLGAVHNTFCEVFGHVAVFCTKPEGPVDAPESRDTFVLVGAMVPLEFADGPGKAEDILGPHGSRLNDNDLAVIRERSGGLVLTDDFAPVEHLLAEVVRVSGRTYQSLVIHAEALLAGGQFERALEPCLRAVRIEPDNPRGHYVLGGVYRGMGEPENAESAYRRVVELNPYFVPGHVGLAMVVRDLGRVSEAVDELQRAVDLEPGSAWLHFNMGLLFELMGRADAAEAAYGYAIELRPDFARAHCMLGTRLCAAGRVDEGIAHLVRAVQIDRKDYVLHRNLGTALFNAGRYAPARDALAEAVGLEPGAADCHYFLGQALLRLGQTDDAAGCFRRALELNPGYEAARRGLERASAVPAERDAKSRP